MGTDHGRRRRPGHRSRFAAAAALPLVAAAAACQGGPLAPDPLEQAVSAYYEAHAIEENRFCLAPYMVGVTRVRPVEDDDAGRRVVRVRYRYSDRFIAGAENIGRCTGFEARTFTLAAARGGWRVLDMSGPQRGRS